MRECWGVRDADSVPPKFARVDERPRDTHIFSFPLFFPIFCFVLRFDFRVLRGSGRGLGLTTKLKKFKKLKKNF